MKTALNTALTTYQQTGEGFERVAELATPSIEYYLARTQHTDLRTVLAAVQRRVSEWNGVGALAWILSVARGCTRLSTGPATVDFSRVPAADRRNYRLLAAGLVEDIGFVRRVKRNPKHLDDILTQLSAPFAHLFAYQG